MLTRELEIATHLARQAGRVLLDIYATDFAVHFKGVADPVTEADQRANELIVAGLRQAFPDDGIVAEETADRTDAYAGKQRCWYVDPLDGTKEFVSKNGEFSVMIGLAIHGRAALGVVYRAVGDKLYSGVVGNGATLTENGHTRALGVSAEAQASKLRLVVSRSHRSSATDALTHALGITEERASGSVGLKIGLIAEQDADFYVHLSKHSSAWDACAPDAILRAAGGTFTDLFGAPFIYGRGEIQNVRGILACNAAAFDNVAPACAKAASAIGMTPFSDNKA